MAPPRSHRRAARPIYPGVLPVFVSGIAGFFAYRLGFRLPWHAPLFVRLLLEAVVVILAWRAWKAFRGALKAQLGLFHDPRGRLPAAALPHLGHLDLDRERNRDQVLPRAQVGDHLPGGIGAGRRLQPIEFRRKAVPLLHQAIPPFTPRPPCWRVWHATEPCFPIYAAVPVPASPPAGTSIAQKAQRRAAIGISLRHSGHLRVLGSGDWRRRMREVSTFTGLTTKKNRAKATVRNATRAFRKSP